MFRNVYLSNPIRISIYDVRMDAMFKAGEFFFFLEPSLRANDANRFFRFVRSCENFLFRSIYTKQGRFDQSLFQRIAIFSPSFLSPSYYYMSLNNN